MKKEYIKDEKALKELNEMEFNVTQQCGTEPAFRNKFWDHKEEGLYVDIVSGEPLFSSIDKFNSHSGWPSFTKPVEKDHVIEHADESHGMRRVEVKSRHGNSHLGHVFPDGPREDGGMRYCINSASLRFVPKDKLKEEGYEDYVFLFEKDSMNQKEATKETAILAGGCFWGVQDLLRKLDGVLNTKVGYTGGHTQDATYKKIKQGDTGHAEAIEIVFDPNVISYKKILEFFFTIHDSTTLNRQGNDIGDSYRSAIFFINETQEKIANELIEEINASGILPATIKTNVIKATEFFNAEEEHQDYLEKHPGGYTCHWIRPEWDLKPKANKSTAA